MLEYITTGVIVLLLYAAVIGVLILIAGGEDEIQKMDAAERDEILPYKVERKAINYCDDCGCWYYGNAHSCAAALSEGTGTPASSDGSQEG